MRRKSNRFWITLKQKISQLFRRFSRLPEEDEISDEPIDFSAPSVPYYADLSEKFNLARIVLYMILFAFVVVTVLSSRHLITYENLYYLVKDVSASTITAQSEAEYLNYPISESNAAFTVYRGGLTVVGGQEITVLSGSGKQTLSENVSLSYPCVRAGDQTFLVFSRGEKDFSVYNAFVRLRKEYTEYPVFDARMSKNGSFAILTRSADYTSEVIFYDSDFDKLAAAHIGGYVTSLSLSGDGKTLAALSLELTDSGYVTKLTLLRRGTTGITNREVFVEGVTAIQSAFADDERLAVIFEDALRIYRTDGTLISEIPFEGSTPTFCTVSKGYVSMLFTSGQTLTETELAVYDKNGGSVYRIKLDTKGTVSELTANGQNVYVRMGSRILYVSSKGNRLSEIAVHKDTLTLLVTDSGELMACTPAFAHRIHPDDFTPLS